MVAFLLLKIENNCGNKFTGKKPQTGMVWVSWITNVVVFNPSIGRNYTL